MTDGVIVAGTDTDIGKTVFAAALAGAIDGAYWKPIQAGLDGETDTDVVRRLSGLPSDRILPEAYRLATAASPHLAAERDGVTIDIETLTPPRVTRPLVIELAGGLAVPLTRTALQIDAIARWRMPVILCSATRLGTINHTLLSVEALKRRAIPILGIAFIGDENSDSQCTIGELARVQVLGRLPLLKPLDAANLRRAFTENFDSTRCLGVGASGP